MLAASRAPLRDGGRQRLDARLRAMALQAFATVDALAGRLRVSLPGSVRQHATRSMSATSAVGINPKLASASRIPICSSLIGPRLGE